VVIPFRRTPAAAKGWLLLIFFEPWIGLLLYALIGRPTMPRSRVEQMARLPGAMAKVRERVLNHPNVFHPEPSPGLEWTGYLAEKLGRMPLLGGNAAAKRDGREIRQRIIPSVYAPAAHPPRPAAHWLQVRAGLAAASGPGA
jgi:hypothetical protein